MRLNDNRNKKSLFEQNFFQITNALKIYFKIINQNNKIKN